MQFKLDIGLCTHRGRNPSRPINEDSVMAWQAHGADTNGVCAVVALADGMGGGDFGERASLSAVQLVSDAFYGDAYLQWARGAFAVARDVRPRDQDPGARDQRPVVG